MRTEAEIGGTRPQAEEHQEPPETGRGRKASPLETTGGVRPLILDFRLPELRENKFVLFSAPQLCGSLSQPP